MLPDSFRLVNSIVSREYHHKILVFALSGCESHLIISLLVMFRLKGGRVQFQYLGASHLCLYWMPRGFDRCRL
jgi:hypothetical protein